MTPADHSGGQPAINDPIPGDGSRLRRRLVIAGVLTASMVSLLLAIAPLRRVVGAIDRMGSGWICAAVALELASCCSFAIVFRLFFDRVPGPAARELAWTALGAGSLLPGGGVGALAVSGWLLHQAGISKTEILQRSSGLFLLTSAASVTAMIAAGGLLIAGVLPGPHDVLRAGVPFLAGGAVIVAVLALPHVWRRSNTSAREGWVDDLVDGTGAAVRSLTRPTWRLLGSVGYLAFDIGVLWATFAAAGREPPLAALTLGYIIGYLANLLPVPGSIGVLDLGLAGTLIAYGAHATQAAAAVLVYHAIAFWIPSVGGLLAYTLLRRRLADSSSTMETTATGARSVPEPWAPGAIPTRAG